MELIPSSRSSLPEVLHEEKMGMWEALIFQVLRIILEVWKGSGKAWGGMRGVFAGDEIKLPKKRVDIEIPTSFQQ